MNSWSVRMFLGAASVAILLAGTPPRAVAAPQESRIWTDSTGKFRVEATLVSQDGESATLRKADGRTITTPTSRLSSADREYLASLDENPFEGGVAESAAASERTAETSGWTIPGATRTLDGFARPVVVGDRSQEKRTTFDGVAPDWQVVPPQRVAARGDVRPVPLFADSRLARFAAITDEKIVAPLASDASLYVGFRVGFGADETNWLERCDVDAGAGEIVEISAPAFRLTDVSPDGKFALGVCATKNKFGLATPALAAILPLERFGETPRLETAAVFDPFFDPKAPEFASPPEIRDAIWIDSTSVLTTTRDEAVLWNLETGRSVYSFPTQNSTVAFDPTRSIGAFATPEKVVLFAPKTGALLGKLDLAAGAADVSSNDANVDSGVDSDFDAALKNAARHAAASAFYPTSIAFSPDGARLAAATASAVDVFELRSGASIGSFPVDRPFNAAFGWASSDFVLVGSILHDVATGVPLCDYRGFAPGPNGVVFASDRVWTICSGGANVRSLVGFELPHSAAVDALKNVDLKSNFALYPGVSVALRTETNGLLDENETRGYLEKRLQETGFRLDPNADVVLTARCVDLGREVEADYSVDSSPSPFPFAVPRPPRLPLLARNAAPLGSVKLKVFAESLEFSSGGESLWKLERETTGPQNVEFDSKKTLERTLRDANRPDGDFFQFAPLPKFFRKGGRGGAAILQARATPDGVR